MPSILKYNFRGKRLLFTKHALYRLDEAGISLEKAKILLRRAGKKKTERALIFHKLLKFGEQSVEYYSNSAVDFTVRQTKDQVIVITVTSFRTNKDNKRWVKK